ncbi:YicC/YloC family endoribonuclease [Vagococcus vulneris]|nr:YicC/YloC family endoribonuclease [Vagococcus vulneris]
MTGFGKAELQTSAYDLMVEIKSVNHRFLDIQCRLPRELLEFELGLKQLVKQVISRGRVECFITFQSLEQSRQTIRMNTDLIKRLAEDVTRTLQKEHGTTITADSLMQGAIMHPALFEVLETPVKNAQLSADLETVFQQALKNLCDSRRKEGSGVEQVLRNKLSQAEQAVQIIYSLQDLYEADYQQRLTQKITELIGNHVDQDRLLTETALLIEKADISEELDRLMIHIAAYKQLLTRQSSIGKEADFLTQEFNREVNTIGSKTSVIKIKEQVIILKTLIEKMREQVQNVE